MERKLVQQGASTMMISLPAKWIKDNKLSKGSAVVVENFDRNLLISASAIQIRSETAITLMNLAESSIRTLITNTYRSGYDTIKVAFSNEKQFQILNDTIKTKLIGFDIKTRDKSSCIVENITEPALDKIDTIINKIFFNISEFIELTRNRLKGDINLDYEELQERIQRYDNFCRRVISKQSISEKSQFLFTFLHLLLHGHRELYHMNKAITKNMKLSNSTLKLFDECEALYEVIKKVYQKKDLNLLAKAHEMERKAIYKEGYALLEKSRGKETIILHCIISSIRKFFQTNSPLTGLIMS